jgi:hypothetical protein
MSREAMWLVYFSYFHSILIYGIIYWCNSANSKYIFNIQKSFRLNSNSGIREFCRELFKNLQILPLASQYIFSLLLFLVENRELFKFNSDIHHIATGYNNNFHLP